MQNRAANPTCTGRVGTSTPGKAGSVSEETKPRVADASTFAPTSLGASSKRSVAAPTTARPANSGVNQFYRYGSAGHQSSPCTTPSAVPSIPTSNPVLVRRPPPLPSRKYRPTRPPRNKAGVVNSSAGTTGPITNPGESGASN